MNKDLQLFAQIIKKLTFLTTSDEYGSSRSKGIETFAELYEELNEAQIVPQRGYWTEASLRIFIHRIKRRYSEEILLDVSDLEFIGANAWEYQSYTRANEIISKGHNVKTPVEAEHIASYPLYTYEDIDGMIWKDHEVNELRYEDRKIIRKAKFLRDALKRKRDICH